eukprot:g17161.t1
MSLRSVILLLAAPALAISSTSTKIRQLQDPAAPAAAPPAQTADHEVDKPAYEGEWHKEFRDESYPSSAAGKEHSPMISALHGEREQLPWGWGSAWFWLSGAAVTGLVGVAVVG